MHPFGMRIFVEVDNKSLDNIGSDILIGKIIEVSTQLELVRNDKSYVKDMNTLLYHLSDELQVGEIVLFKNDNNVIDVKNSIYNVPIELIRQVSSNEK